MIVRYKSTRRGTAKAIIRHLRSNKLLGEVRAFIATCCYFGMFGGS